MINMTEYAKRRKTLLQQLEKDAIVILPSAKESPRNNDTFFPFRQNSDFYYLTGFEEPDAVLVLLPKRKEGEFVLFNRVRDPDREIWDGPRAGQAGAIKQFGADQAFPISDIDKLLPSLLAGRSHLYYSLGQDNEFDHKVIAALNHIRRSVRSGIEAPFNLLDVGQLIHEMRLFKSPAEIATMQTAVDITAAAHKRAMSVCRPGLYEYELEAEITYVSQRRGARYPAYSPIVGSGANSCILHYIANNKKIADGDLVLIDAGAEYQNYAADITRTFPANGRFSKEQKAIYNLVLKAQLAAIATIKPGASFLNAQKVVVNTITKGLLALGILKGNLKDLLNREAYSPFYMHRSGHWLGLDVHDVGKYCINQKWRQLEPGMVLTVEPGIYISEQLKVDPRWHNIGVRIEDDVLVTKTGHDVLSKAIPKQIDEIEALMQQSRNA